MDIDFGVDEIGQLHASALRDSYLSKSDALSAHVLAVLRDLNPDQDRPMSSVVLMINYRKRMGLPKNLLGNVINSAWMNVSASADTATTAAGLRAKLNAYAHEFSPRHLVLHQHNRPRNFRPRVRRGRAGTFFSADGRASAALCRGARSSETARRHHVPASARSAGEASRVARGSGADALTLIRLGPIGLVARARAELCRVVQTADSSERAFFA